MKYIFAIAAVPFIPLVFVFLLGLAILGHMVEHTRHCLGDVCWEIKEGFSTFPRTVIDLYVGIFTGRDLEDERNNKDQ
jgi:hypothetical protein